ARSPKGTLGEPQGEFFTTFGKASRYSDYEKQHGRSTEPKPLRARALAFAQPLLRLAAESADQRPPFVGRGGQPRPVDAAQHQRHPKIAAPEIGIGTDFDVVVARLQSAQVLRQGPLAEVTTDAAAEHLVAAFEAIFQLLENPLHDAGNT